jgi:hypothetical protein
VNDLDLTVQASGLAGYTLYGNGEPDKLNNVERVHLPPSTCAAMHLLACSATTHGCDCPAAYEQQMAPAR